MGTIEPENAPLGTTALADALFTPVQQRVLGLLFGEPNRRFQSAVLIRLADSGTGATHRVLKRLADSGLVRATVDGRQKYYQANPDSPVFEEMVGLVRKTSGLVTPLRKALAPLGDSIRAAFASLRYVTRQPMTNTSVRERFGIAPVNKATASRLIRESLEAGMIRLANEDVADKLRAYVPYRA